MRDILLKAKKNGWNKPPKGEWLTYNDIHRNEWVEGAVLSSDDETRIVTSYLKEMGDEDDIVVMVATYKVDPDSVCQYIGLNDKHEFKIWENDIVLIDSEGDDEYFLVEWDEETARFCMTCEGFTVDFDNYYTNEIEVVGNIFDNPELLE